MSALSPPAALEVADGTLQRVRFDLRKESKEISYDAGSVKGKVVLKLGLGLEGVSLPDPLENARADSLEVKTVPVKAKDSRRISIPQDLTPEDAASPYTLPDGFTSGIEIEEGTWVKAGRVDSDLGMLLVSTRMTRELRTTVQLELQQRNYVGMKRSKAHVRVEGVVVLAVKVQFERSLDRTMWERAAFFFQSLWESVVHRASSAA